MRPSASSAPRSVPGKKACVYVELVDGGMHAMGLLVRFGDLPFVGTVARGLVVATTSQLCWWPRPGWLLVWCL